MEMELERDILAAAAAAADEPHPSGESSDDEFEFSFPVGDGAEFAADEIYPVFNRGLLPADEEQILEPLRALAIGEERGGVCSRSGSTSSSSSAEGQDGPAEGTYCVWRPPGCKKSSSAGSSPPPAGATRRWRMRDLVVGRSRSDGKEKFVFLAADEPARGKRSQPPPPMAAAVKKGKAVTEMDMVTAHRLFYGKGGAAVNGRRTIPPYKRNLVGFFADANGISRTHHPV